MPPPDVWVLCFLYLAKMYWQQQYLDGEARAACPPYKWLSCLSTIRSAAVDHLQQAASTLGVSEMVVRRLIAQKILPAKQIVKFAPWMIERTNLELPAVRKGIRRVHVGRRTGWAVSEKQTGLFADSHEA